MLEAVLIGVGLAGLVVGSYADIETREIPNWLNFSLIAAGLGIRAIGALAEKNWWVFAAGILGLVAMIAVGNLLYYSRQWGGGDTKLLIGLGALFGAMSFLPWFLLHFLINLVVIGAVYGFLWSMYLAIRHRHRFVVAFRRIVHAHRHLLMICIGMAVILFAVSFLLPSLMRLVVWILAGVLVMYGVMIVFVKTVEDACMFRKIRLKNITEGDWIAENVVVKGKTLYRMTDPGVSREQISLMKKCNVKRVLVKEGIPFVPSFLFAMILTLVVGNIFLVMI